MLRLFCLFSRHKPDFATIQTEDNAYTAACLWCDKDIIKRRHTAWRTMDKSAAKASSTKKRAQNL